ncbi:phage tail protein [Rahnella sp. PD12R]|uniref:phage tail protein n=1 Tax=Rahnella sp. PD12R TaxID=2855688 RepID=UPI002107A524|nr:phage tail protein [Rahnella sp. PD12R]
MSKFKSVVTALGQARIASAIESGKDVNITQLAVGDGNGNATTPSASQTALVHETYRLPLNSIKTDNKNANWIIAEAIIPASVGGFWMREMGLFSSEGELIAVSNMADSYKPTLEEGSGRTQTLRMVITVTDTDAVTLTIDDTLVIATEEYVNNLLAEHEASRRHPDGTLTDKGFVQLSSAVDSASEVLAATPKAVKTSYDLAKSANDNANGRLPSGGTAVAATKLATARKIAGVAFDGTADIGITAANVGAVQQGGGQDMTSNKIMLGWNGGKLIAQVDNTPMGALYSETNKPTAKDTGAVPIAGGDVGYLNNASHYGIKAGIWEGVGSFANQYKQPFAPFLVPYGYIAPQNASSYAPIIKGVIQTATYGYGTAISFGAYTTGEPHFAKGAVNIVSDSGASLTWFFDSIDGTFGSPGGISANGNIYSSLGIYEQGQRVYSPNNPQPNIVQDMRFAASAEYQERSNNERIDGGVMTSFKDAGSSNYWIRIRQLQKLINNNWYTVGYS